MSNAMTVLLHQDTLREAMAAAAMQGILASTPGDQPLSDDYLDDVARSAVAAADKVLAELRA